jgi:hypothetical protein
MFTVTNHHSAECGEPPVWAREPTREAYKGYFENGYGEQWVVFASKERFEVTGGDIGWKPIVVENPNYQELLGEATIVFLTLTKAKGLERCLGDISFRGTILNAPEAAWLVAVLRAKSCSPDRTDRTEKGA